MDSVMYAYELMHMHILACHTLFAFRQLNVTSVCSANQDLYTSTARTHSVRILRDAEPPPPSA